MNAPANIIPFPAPSLYDSVRRDLTLAQCRALAEAAQHTQPSNALYSRTPEELTDAIFAIAGGRR